MYIAAYAQNKPDFKTGSIKNYNSAREIIPPVSDAVTSCSIRANQLASIGFNFTGRGIDQLYNEYNWYIYHDHEKPIMAFLKIKEEPNVMDNFLGTILSAEDRSYEFIDSIARSGKELLKITDGLKKVVGENSQSLMTFMPQCPYTKAYKNYIIQRYDNANTITEILKIRPDWAQEALLAKYDRLKPGKWLKIGNIPNEFPQEFKTYDKITDYLRPKMQNGYKNEQKIPDLKTGNRTYKFESFTNGKSDKNVFCITVPEGKKFVLKMGNEDDRGLNKPFGLGTLSLIDTYLTTNRSKNSAPLRFYDHQKNVSIYSYIEHCPIKRDEVTSLSEVNNKLPDFKKLGLYYNDTIGSNNYFQLKDIHKNAVGSHDIENGIRNNEWISVDNDHVTFASLLHPRIDGLHRALPDIINVCW